jgi:Glycosyl transferase family 2
MPDDQQPTVSIIIKAFNEERHIAGAIESALTALAGIGGEVILADGASTDRTIAIAQKYPIKIVRLDDPADRSCGAGAQLGFQYAGGEYICLMDGDMRLRRPFLAAGIRALNENPALGGVCGAVIDHDADNLEYAQRVRRFDPDRQPGLVTRLGGCGLYRRAAITSVGYCTDRNLHGCEELEMAARLRIAGWTLARIDCTAVDHYCRAGNPYRQLLRRIRIRNCCGPGEIIRAAIGRPQFGYVVRSNRSTMLSGLVGLWWCSIAAALLSGSGVWAPLAAAALLILPFAAMAFRWGSLRDGIYSVTAWNAYALCFLPGFFWPRKPPADWIASHVIKDPAADRGSRRVAQR